MPVLFSWDDGEEEIYETVCWTPNVERPTEARGQIVPLLSGGTMWVTQDGEGDIPIIPGIVRLSWEWADPLLLPIAEDTFRNKRQVTVIFPWRGSTETITGYAINYQERPGSAGCISLEVTIQEVSI
jgi:hypothetical protein